MILTILTSISVYMIGALMTYRAWHKRGDFAVSRMMSYGYHERTISQPSLMGWKGFWDIDCGSYYNTNKTGIYVIPVAKRICFFLWIPIVLTIGFRELGLVSWRGILAVSKGPSFLFDVVTPKSNLMVQMPIIKDDKYLLEAVNEVNQIAPN